MTVQGVIDHISYWTPETDPDWPVLNPLVPPQLLQNAPMALCVWWTNTGTENIIGHVDLTLVMPDASTQTVPAVLYQDEEAAPGSGFGVGFAEVVLSQAGQYQAEIALLGEAVVLPEVPFDVVSVWSSLLICGPSSSQHTVYATIKNIGSATATHRVVCGFCYWGVAPTAWFGYDITLAPGAQATFQHTQGLLPLQNVYSWVRALKNSDSNVLFDQDYVALENCP